MTRKHRKQYLTGLVIMISILTSAVAAPATIGNGLCNSLLPETVPTVVGPSSPTLTYSVIPRGGCIRGNPSSGDFRSNNSSS